MTLASYIRRERIIRMRQFLAGKLSLAPRWTGRLLAGKNCLQITTRFRFLVYSAFFLRSNTMSTPLKVKIKETQIATRRRNFETRAMLDCRCYGQHSHKNESRTEIRREPRAVFVLDKTFSYKWSSSRLI